MRRLLPVAVLNAAVLTAGLLAVGSDVDERYAAAGEPGALQVASPATPPPAPGSPSPRGQQAVRPRAAAPRPAPTPAAPTATPVPVRRVIAATGFRPYARVGPVTLHFPGAVVEVVGLHESGHDGALPQLPASTVAPIGRLGSRERGTHGQGAADIVMSPASRVRAPVTGTVLRAGTYTLYCDHVDQYLVVEPDARPGWEVKLLHVTGLVAQAGDRVRRA